MCVLRQSLAQVRIKQGEWTRADAALIDSAWPSGASVPFAPLESAHAAVSQRGGRAVRDAVSSPSAVPRELLS